MKAAILVALAMCCGAAGAATVAGGTLHRATLREWHQAAAANQYATAADIVERFLNIRDPLALAPKARDVHSCICRVSANFQLRSQTVSDTAIACMAQLGYLPH
jgi:dihydrodipicolinate synthase/N-acetylneuraminate lyase